MEKVVALLCTKRILVPIVTLMLAFQMLFVSQQFDAYALLKDEGIKTWQIPFAYIGSLPKFLLLLVAIYLMLKIASDSEVAKESGWVSDSRPLQRFAFIVFQVLCFGVLVFLTRKIFLEPESASQVSISFYISWIVAAGLVLIFTVLAMMPIRDIKRYFYANLGFLLTAFPVSIFAFILASESQRLWSVLADKTFFVTTLLLNGYDSSLLTVDADEKLVGLGDFVVKIDPACSGYEGIGLVTAFTSLFLYVYRKQFIFPWALLLLPAGALTIWILNSVRIAALIAIGYHWSPDIAVSGFHSHAGWITFIFTSIGLLWIASASGLIKRSSLKVDRPAGFSLAVAALMPFIALMAMTLFTGTFTANFDYLYPLRVIVVGAVIISVWNKLELGSISVRLEPILVALLVAIGWVLLLEQRSDAADRFIEGLSSMPIYLSLVWIAFRIVGAVVTVPIAEELMFRGYMLARLSGSDLITQGRVPVSVVAIVVSSVAFGVLHGDMIAGTLAGFAFAWLRLRGCELIDVILSHALANAILFGYAGMTGAWWVI